MKKVKLLKLEKYFANLKLSDKIIVYIILTNKVVRVIMIKMEKGKESLMKTPINGARLSSPFGMRKHPIDGFNKMHRGTDFAAPMGTPIMASGDGVIKKQAGVVVVEIVENKTQFNISNYLCSCLNLHEE